MPAEVVLRSLRHVWKTLEPLRMPMAVVGGFALAAWKHVRATRDVDLLVAVGHGGLEEIFSRLRAAEIRPKRDPPVAKLGQLEIAQFLYEPPETFLDLEIDLLLARSGYHVEALARRVPVRLPNLDIDVAVLACEDLILTKLLAGRIIDRVDAAALLRANRGEIDFPYLTRWAGSQGLMGDLSSAWKEAFPKEPLPEVAP